jgi:ribosomal protein S27E
MSNPHGPEGVLTLVCLTCGNEKTYADRPPAQIVCEMCGSTVFRNFFTPTEADEATIAQLEETARSIALDDDSPGTSPDDVRDVNNP